MERFVDTKYKGEAMDLTHEVDRNWMQGNTPKIRIDVWDKNSPDRPHLVTFINVNGNVDGAIEWLKKSWRDNPPSSK
jgi:hypothetical protein